MGLPNKAQGSEFGSIELHKFGTIPTLLEEVAGKRETRANY